MNDYICKISSVLMYFILLSTVSVTTIQTRLRQPFTWPSRAYGQSHTLTYILFRIILLEALKNAIAMKNIFIALFST